MIDTSLIYDIFEEGKRLAACEYLEYWFDLGSLRDLKRRGGVWNFLVDWRRGEEILLRTIDHLLE